MTTNRMVLYALATLSGLLGAVGDILLTKWSKTDVSAWLLGGFLCWNVALTVFLFMLKRAFLAHCVVLFVVTNTLIAVVASRFYFQDIISGQKWVGILLVVIALVVMELG